MHPHTSRVWTTETRVPKAGLKNITFDGLRDRARDAADDAHDLAGARMLVGHSIGIDDHYVPRRAIKREQLVQAIEARCFGQPEKADE